MDGVFTVTAGTYVQWNQFSIFVRHDADCYVGILIFEFGHVLIGEWKRKTVGVQFVQVATIVMCATRILFVVNRVKSGQNGIEETLFVVQILNVNYGLFHSNFARRRNEGCALCRTKRSVCYAEIENRFNNPVRSTTIEILDSRQKFASDTVCRYVVGVRYYIRLCAKACRCVLKVAICSGTTERNV